MRKTIRLAAAGVLMSLSVLMLTACGSSSGSSSDSAASVQSSEKGESASKEEAKTESEEKDNQSETITIEETLLLDRDDLKITAKTIEDDLFGTAIKLLIENNGDKSVTVQARNTNVNGYMVDNMMSEEVASEKKSNTSLTLSSTDLKACGIDTISEIGIQFHVFDSESWDTIFDSDIVELHTSAYGSYEQTYDDAGTVLYDQNGIKIVSKGLSDDSLFGPGALLYIENNSDTAFTVQARETSVNGFMIDPIMSENVLPGKKAITAMTFLSTYLEENDISEITSIETSFHIFSTDDWDTIADTDPITIEY